MHSRQCLCFTLFSGSRSSSSLIKIIPASDPKHSKQIINNLSKNAGFDQNGGRHQLRHEKMMHFYNRDADFRATATKIIKNWSKTLVLTKTAAAMSSGTKKWWIFIPEMLIFEPRRPVSWRFLCFCDFWKNGSPTRHTGGPLTKIMKIFPGHSDLNSLFLKSKNP